jgi:2-polyprenyl-6-methoxyphenol hydroxylase-like FAD-dependent oxidoreductase
MSEPNGTVLIAGAGIAGLSLALTCHQIGVPVKVFESVHELKPLGVGINLQPNAVRELYDLGLADELAEIGVETKEWALVGRNGNDVWAEPRGLLAGYSWPQYSIHRGRLQMLLYKQVVDRLGPDCVTTGTRVVAYENTDTGASVTIAHRGAGTSQVEGAVLIAGDGLHSAVRAQMHPDDGDPHWGGAFLWRGTSLGKPIRSGASFTLVGSLEQRFVHYPISDPDPVTGLQVQNWLAERTVDPDNAPSGSDWNQQVDIAKFLPEFEDWNFDWLDIPALIRKAEAVYEFPMVDRDPVDHWVDGNVALSGDAAHVMYPVGSNGASQAIVDARVLGAKFIQHGVTHEALLAYESELLEDISALVLRNRGDGPVAILGEVNKRCGGVFDNIEDVISSQEIDEFMSSYKTAAGFGIDALNAAPSTIAI